MESQIQNQDPCEFCEATSTTTASTVPSPRACVLKAIYSNHHERGKEQGFYFNLLDRLNVCSYCNSFNPDSLVVPTHEDTHICCHCAKRQSSSFIAQLEQYVLQHAIPINSTETKSLQKENNEVNPRASVDLFSLLRTEAEWWRKHDTSGSSRLTPEHAESSGKIKSSNLNKHNSGNPIAPETEDIVVERVINWDYVSLTYFLSDFSILSRNIKMVEERVARPFGYDHKEPINVTFASYLDKFSDVGVLRVPISEQRVFMAVLAFLKKYNVYKIVDTPELVGHFTVLSTLQDNHISNLVAAINRNEAGIVDYLQLLRESYAFSQSRAQGYLRKIGAKLAGDAQYYKECRQQHAEAQNRIEYIKVCDIIKTYRGLSNQYLDIEKDLEFYTTYVHSRINFKLNKDETSQPRPHLAAKHYKDAEHVDANGANGQPVEGGVQAIAARIQDRADITIESDCSVCFVADTSYFNPIVYCSSCEMGAHIKCIGLSEVPSDNYFCHKCQHSKHQKFCIICGIDSYFLQKARDSTIAYHTYCAFMSKQWALRVKSNALQPNKMKSNLMTCIHCNSTKGVIDTCADCQMRHYHALCGYLNGQHFRVVDYDKLNFEEYMGDKYSYSIETKCDNCSRRYFAEKLNRDAESAKTLVLKVKYLRRASIDPRFNKAYLEFDEYVKHEDSVFN